MSWQPIETAPKTHAVLLWLPMGRPVVGYWEKQGYYKNPRPYWKSSDEYLFGIRWSRDNQPTHWMPLPAPPEAK